MTLMRESSEKVLGDAQPAVQLYIQSGNEGALVASFSVVEEKIYCDEHKYSRPMCFFALFPKFLTHFDVVLMLILMFFKHF